MRRVNRPLLVRASQIGIGRSPLTRWEDDDSLEWGRHGQHALTDIPWNPGRHNQASPRITEHYCLLNHLNRGSEYAHCWPHPCFKSIKKRALRALPAAAMRLVLFTTTWLLALLACVAAESTANVDCGSSLSADQPWERALCQGGNLWFFGSSLERLMTTGKQFLTPRVRVPFYYNR